MKKITIEDGRYEVGEGVGAWAKSHESVERGTVRVIGGKLMEAKYIWSRRWWQEPVICWTPVDDKGNSYEALRAWMASL